MYAIYNYKIRGSKVVILSTDSFVLLCCVYMAVDPDKTQAVASGVVGLGS